MTDQKQTALGIELGSTRIKSVLVDKSHSIIATGSFSWENRYENGLWTYSLEDALKGVQASFAALREDFRQRHGEELVTTGAMGISGMMHGIVALDARDRQLAPFLTWRNTNTSEASEKLTQLFGFNVPLRWTVSQLYQAMIEKKEYLGSLSYACTLACWVHYMLSANKVCGVGEASGMFPIDSQTMDYDAKMVAKFDSLLSEGHFNFTLRDVLPKVLCAGDEAGVLTEEGALLLDPSGSFKAGVRMVPPEGDAGTGMVATDSVALGTGNVSAGTSVFSMVVLEKPLSRLYRDIDMVTTPSGRPVAMVHCNNGTSELDRWFRLFSQFLEAVGSKAEPSEIYSAMYGKSLEGKHDCADVISFNYLSGEPVSGLLDGRPMLVSRADSDFSFANFMRSQLYSVFASLSIGNRILEQEKVKIKRLTGHGGMFKTTCAAQLCLSAAMKAPVTVMRTAGEGGPYGMALLASYALWRDEGESLEDYLEDKVFSNAAMQTVCATKEDIDGFASYMDKYLSLLEAQRVAVKVF